MAPVKWSLACIETKKSEAETRYDEAKSGRKTAAL